MEGSGGGLGRKSKTWFLSALLAHGLPVVLLYSAFFVLTWDGRVLENMAMAIYWPCFWWTWRAWWKKMAAS